MVTIYQRQRGRDALYPFLLLWRLGKLFILDYPCPWGKRSTVSTKGTSDTPPYLRSTSRNILRLASDNDEAALFRANSYCFINQVFLYKRSPSSTRLCQVTDRSQGPKPGLALLSLIEMGAGMHDMSRSVSSYRVSDEAETSIGNRPPTME